MEGSGGGIQNASPIFNDGVQYFGTLTITGGEVTGNTAVVDGGISNEPGAVLTLDGVTISGNIPGP